jgi:hypothetical protein
MSDVQSYSWRIKGLLEEPKTTGKIVRYESGRESQFHEANDQPLSSGFNGERVRSRRGRRKVERHEVEGLSERASSTQTHKDGTTGHGRWKGLTKGLMLISGKGYLCAKAFGSPRMREYSANAVSARPRIRPIVESS